jgi:hypothetical protein
MRGRLNLLGMAVLLLLCLAGSALAVSCNLTVTGIKKHNGTSDPDGTTNVTAYTSIYNSIPAPDSNGNCTATPVSFSSNSLANLITAVQGNNVNNFYFTSASWPSDGYLILRFWDGTPGSGANSWYCDQAFPVSTTTPVNNLSGAFVPSNYINNDSPAPPSIAINTLTPEKLSRTGLTVPATFGLQLNYVISKATGDRTPLITNEVRVVKKDKQTDADPAWPAAKDDIQWFVNSTNSTPINDYYVGGKDYKLEARAGNLIGWSAWGPVCEYPSAAGSNTGGPQKQTWHHKISTTGINTFAYPFSTASSVKKNDGTELGNSGVVTVQQLIEEINKLTLANKQNVSAFGWYDAAQQKLVGLTAIPMNAYNPSTGTVADPSVMFATTGNPAGILSTNLITMAQPYQVSVREAVDVTLEGTVQTSR